MNSQSDPFDFVYCSRNSHYFAYLHTFVVKKYVIGDGYYTCVPVRILFQKTPNLEFPKLIDS